MIENPKSKILVVDNSPTNLKRASHLPEFKLENFLRLLARGGGGTTRGAGAGGMNTTKDFIAGCLQSF